MDVAPPPPPPPRLVLTIDRIDAHLITGLLVAAATHRAEELTPAEERAVRNWWRLVMDADPDEARRTVGGGTSPAGTERVVRTVEAVRDTLARLEHPEHAEHPGPDA